MKWITAQVLDQWAGTQIGRAEVSRLVGQLVCASAARVGSFRFPSGDSAGIPGYDGHLIAECVPPFVPDGESVWEFGTGVRGFISTAGKKHGVKIESWKNGAATAFTRPSNRNRPTADSRRRVPLSGGGSALGEVSEGQALNEPRLRATGLPTFWPRR